MTNEEAIKHLQTYSTTMGSGQTTDEQHKEAKRMAIEALSNNNNQTNSELKTTTESVSATDVIYRADAIDAIKTVEVNFTVKSDINFADYQKTVQDIFNNVLYAQEQVLKQLPSAQPDKDMIHLQKEQAYMQGWADGQNALREEMWEDGRDRLN